MQRVRAFAAVSLDGFMAGPNDELDWLAPREGVEDTFTPFLQQVGALLMGRRTYDVVCGFDGPWPYGETPVRVATTRPLGARRLSVQPVGGAIEDLIAEARAAAGEGDIYIDGGQLVRAALDAGLLDQLTVTIVPIVLGAGLSLFAGASRRHALELLDSRAIGGGLVELRYAAPR